MPNSFRRSSIWRQKSSRLIGSLSGLHIGKSFIDYRLNDTAAFLPFFTPANTL